MGGNGQIYSVVLCNFFICFISILSILLYVNFNFSSHHNILQQETLTSEEKTKFLEINQHIHGKETKFSINDSNIHGKGVFPLKLIQPNEPIGVVINLFKRFFIFIPYHEMYITEDFGIYLNHCENSNSKLVNENGVYSLVASQEISTNEEITVNYNNLPPFLKRPEGHYKKC
jgi:hypothetical protein